ncbi:ZIP family metal transporter [Suipraeoptans intestinalis]|uniref:ZIP family metal transporter n=1 Tax=Suipraeoptans intestinalis TaxID=2606628 RepID=UPI0023F003D5|nr:ZIP family metal transporter [Suipraeoptans intestinalis]MDD7769996.1 ZIP family metal transporter [Suipraeoptans intestinalis]MDY3122087.1 ZIP family metal transporter [Suipraeoptans intestinalis]
MVATFWGLMIPFLGTTAGAACVFFIKKELNHLVQKSLLGFAAGVMVAASVWSLLIPAMEMSDHLERLAFLPAAVGFIAGIFFLLLLDRWIPHLHPATLESEGPKSSLKRSTMLILAVTIHNIPEGISGGAVFAGVLAGNTKVTLAGAFALAIGIAIQNLPEGFIVSLPVRDDHGRKKAFIYGMLSGLVEPVAGGITVLLAAYITPALPFLLAFAAGAMIYVVVEELIPESAEGAHSNVGTLGFAFGFVVMMILDVALG